MSDEQSVEFDVDAIVGGNAESIIAKLSDLSDVQLVDLRRAEAAQVKPRKTVIEAIEAEELGRLEAAEATGLAQADPALLAAEADAAGAQAAKIDQLESQLITADEEIEAQAQRLAVLEAICGSISATLRERGLVEPGDAYVLTDKIFAIIDTQAATIVERDATIANLRDLIAKGQTEELAKLPKPQKLAELCDLPDLSAVGEVRVLCVGEDGKSLPGISPLLFAPYQFSQEGDGFVLDAPIAFPRETPGTEVAGLFMLIDGKKGLKASLVQPISIGGGVAMELPKGHVKFMPPQPVAAAAG